MTPAGSDPDADAVPRPGSLLEPDAMAIISDQRRRVRSDDSSFRLNPRPTQQRDMPMAAFWLGRAGTGAFPTAQAGSAWSSQTTRRLA